MTPPTAHFDEVQVVQQLHQVPKGDVADVATEDPREHLGGVHIGNVPIGCDND